MSVVSTGTVMVADLDELRPRQRPSLYADPVAWLVLDAVDHAVRGSAEQPAPESTGHIVVSDHCTGHTMRQIAGGLTTGRISPLRFSGANPGAVCGFTCQLRGFTGPSATLSMAPETGLPVALALARAWLSGGAATHVLVSSHHVDAAGHHVTSVLLAPRAEENRDGA